MTRAVVIVADPECNAMPEMSIVIAGKDKDRYPLSETKRQIDTSRFDATTARASLRFPNMRTDCVKAKEDWDRRTAIFKFSDCSREPVVEITIRSNHAIDISYVRRLQTRRRDSVPCEDYASFHSKAEYTVRALRYPDEELDLQLNRDQPNLRKPGLSINEALRRTGALKKGDFVSLDSDTMVEVMAVKRARGNGASPNFSVAAIDLDLRDMKELNMPTVELEVRRVERKEK